MLVVMVEMMVAIVGVCVQVVVFLAHQKGAYKRVGGLATRDDGSSWDGGRRMEWKW